MSIEKFENDGQYRAYDYSDPSGGISKLILCVARNKHWVEKFGWNISDRFHFPQHCMYPVFAFFSPEMVPCRVVSCRVVQFNSV